LPFGNDQSSYLSRWTTATSTGLALEDPPALEDLSMPGVEPWCHTTPPAD
jgi:hypothetical protein